MATPHLATSSSAVLLRTQGDPTKVCGERTTQTLQHRGARGLRSDLGPYYHATNLLYSQDNPAIVRQEDGSGFVFYPSGNRALAISSWNKSRRYSCCVFGDKKSSPILGSFNEWGEGAVCAQARPGSDGAADQPSLSVKKNMVTLCVNGRTTSYSTKAKDSKSQPPIELNLNDALTVKYEFDIAILSFELKAEGVRERIYIGQVHTRVGDGGLTRTTSDGLVEKIKLGSTTDLTKVATDLSSLKSSLNKIHCPTFTTCSLKKLDTSDLHKTVKTLTEGRFQYAFDHQLKAHGLKKNPPVPRYSSQQLEGKPLGIKHWSGKVDFDTNLKDKHGIPDGLCKWVPPKTVTQSTHAQLEQRIQAGNHSLLVAILLSPWDAQSAHGSRLAEGLQGRLKDTTGIELTIVDMSESGALISQTTRVHTIAEKYKVKATPWLLAFSRSGSLLESAKLTGFRDRLRYFSLARSRVLLVEPMGTCEGERAFPRGPKNAMTSQNALKRAKLSADTAHSGRDALTMMGKCESPYGFLFVSTEVPYTEIESIIRLSVQRNPDCIFFLLHHPTLHECDPEVERLLHDPRCSFVFRRPLCTSRIDSVLSKIDSAAYHFPEAGMNAEELYEKVLRLYEKR